MRYDFNIHRLKKQGKAPFFRRKIRQNSGEKGRSLSTFCPLA